MFSSPFGTLDFSFPRLLPFWFFDFSQENDHVGFPCPALRIWQHEGVTSLHFKPVSSFVPRRTQLLTDVSGFMAYNFFSNPRPWSSAVKRVRHREFRSFLCVWLGPVNSL